MIFKYSDTDDNLPGFSLMKGGFAGAGWLLAWRTGKFHRLCISQKVPVNNQFLKR